MEESARSGGVLKKRSSSGCLIIKRKVVNENSGRGLGGLDVNSNERRRSGLVDSCSGSEDDEEPLELMRKNVNDMRMHNGSMIYKRHELEDRRYDRSNVGISSERKRSRADFDEHDEFNGRMERNEYYNNGFNMLPQSRYENVKEFAASSSRRNMMIDKQRQNSYFDGSSSRRSGGFEYNGDKPIRFQGKNGVLKVMVNKKKMKNFPSHCKSYDSSEFKERNHSRWVDDGIKDEFLVQSPIYAASELPETRGLFGDKEKSVDKEKKERKLEKAKAKPLVNKENKGRDSEVEGSHTVLKMTPPDVPACSTEKVMKKEEERSPGPENFSSVKGKEGKPKRGGSTEKQILREKIRGMLLEAGWSIDYRPRRNRDYLDAVYVNPSGTAYWSIIKAYEALKKQLGEDNSKTEVDTTSSLFAPLSEDLINKLTRQTKKKIEEEMKRKRKEDGTEKIVKKPTFREPADSSDCDDDSPKRKPGKIRVENPSDTSKSKAIQGRTSKVIGRCTLIVRPSDKGENSDANGYAVHSGKRTVLAWLIDSGIVQLSEKVRYMNRRRNQIMLEGWITRDGIHCGCCSKILTVSKFEMHAASKLRQPFQNIFLESGSSLLQCQIDAWNNQELSICRDFHTVRVDGDDPEDDTCGICADGGDLICCDSCPSTFHQICLGIELLPKGDWHCPNCICKFCGHAGVSVDEENDSIDHELSICYFCSKKYHTSCSQSMSSSGAPFCELKCQELYDHLQKILGVKNELEAGFSWSLIQRADISDASQRGFAQRVECNSKLAVALSVMDECFYPIIDRRSGINIVQSVVYNCGSNFNRLNFHAFYLIILERGDEIVSAASIRFHGTRIAEMPFIGTREIYRRKGMCRRLFSAIEMELCSMNIERLIIPAISDHMSTWTTVFGFQRFENVHKKEIKSMNVLVFPATDMLQKQLVKPDISSLKVSESTKNRPQMPDLVKKSKKVSSTERSRTTTSASHADGILAIGRINATELDMQNKQNDSQEDVVGNETAGNHSPSTSECSSASFEVNLGSEDADQSKILNNGSTTSQPCSPSEPFISTMNQATVTMLANRLHPSSDSDVTSDAEVDILGSPIREVNDHSLKRGSSVREHADDNNHGETETSSSEASA